MIVLARDEDEDVVSTLGIGADEYLTKPFSPRTLAARARALIRRNTGYARQGEESRIERFGPFELDLDSRNTPEGKGTDTHRGQRVFGVSLSHRGEGETSESRRDIRGRMEPQYGDITAVGVYIQRLRRKIENEPSSPVYILTERGFGYRFESGTSGRTE